jgi:uncharacterized YigZ family protein
MTARYPIPATRHRAEQLIDRSRFVCTLAHAPTHEAARELIEAVRAEWPDATHHCTAWVAGQPGSTTHIGMSDDGEPHGTAGRPMLTTLLHSGIGEVVAVVTRWYGGTKLGTGGLARAYAGSVALALETLPRVERVEWVEVVAVLGYQHVDALHRLLPTVEASTVDEQFAAGVTIRLRLPAGRVAELRQLLADATRGDVVLTTD